MASNGTIAHRFANQDFGRKNYLQGSSTHIDGRNYYSYNTVFGQWVDIEKNVCVYFDGSTSVTSSKHKLGKYCFPSDVHLFPFDDGGSSSYGWHGCNLVGRYKTKDSDFTFERRVELMDYWTNEIYNAFASINGGKTKGLDNHATWCIERYWNFFGELCSLYKDTTIEKYLKKFKHIKYKKGAFKSEKEYVKKYNADIDAKKKMVRLLSDGERDIKTIVDALFGDGTYKKYDDSLDSFRKADRTKAKMLTLCKRLGIKNPYKSSYWDESWKVVKSVKEVRSLTAKERNEIHFASIMAKEWYDKEEERIEKRAKNKYNAYKWIVGYEPEKRTYWSSDYDDSKKCRNMFTGEEYILEYDIWSRSGLGNLELSISFDYQSFRKADNKEQWIREFYEKCAIVDRNIRALTILDKFGESIYTMQYIGWRNYRIYVLNDVIKEGTTPEEYDICKDFIERWSAFLQDKEAQERAERIARERAEADRKAEEEYKAKVKQEQIDACVARGIEGCRDLWRNHLDDVYNAARRMAGNNDDFFFGGNVLMRFNLKKDIIETSKNIRIDIDTCKKMWRMVQIWHEHPEKFRECTINTHYSGTYTISSYENDILTAGCHNIAYCEMERMYNEIISNENAA